jgi:diguanylate cyclase (GGDEF)-like protein
VTSTTCLWVLAQPTPAAGWGSLGDVPRNLLGAAAPDAPRWERLSGPAALAERWALKPAITGVVLVVASLEDALPWVDPAASIAAQALDTVAVIVCVALPPPADGLDTALLAVLYGHGVQDIWLADDALAGLAPQRMAAALARKAAVQASRVAYATDPDTGLVNRQQLVEHLSHLLAVRAREPAPIGLVVLQVGTPQVLNGPLPTELLALVRRKIGVRLRAGVRASDVVASIAPDTFAVMLSSIDTPADTRTVASKLAVAVRHPLTVAGEAVSVPVQVGYAVAPEDGEQPEALLRRAAQRITSTAFNPRQAANDP